MPQEPGRLSADQLSALGSELCQDFGNSLLSSSVFIPRPPCLFRRGSCGVSREKTGLMSHEGQMDQGIHPSWRWLVPLAAPVSTERPLLAVRSRPGAGRLWGCRSVRLLGPGRDMAAASAPGWKGTRSHSAFHPQPGGWGLGVSRGALLMSFLNTLRLLRSRNTTTHAHRIYWAHLQTEISLNLDKNEEPKSKPC